MHVLSLLSLYDYDMTAASYRSGYQLRAAYAPALSLAMVSSAVEGVERRPAMMTRMQPTAFIPRAGTSLYQ